MPLKDIDGVTISTKNKEFIIHIKDNYDYRYDTKDYQNFTREEALKYLIYVYNMKN